MIYGTKIGLMKGDARSLDDGAYGYRATIFSSSDIQVYPKPRA